MTGMTLDEARKLVADEAERKQRLDDAAAVIAADEAGRKTEAQERGRAQRLRDRLAEHDQEVAAIQAAMAIFWAFKEKCEAELEDLKTRPIDLSRKVDAERMADDLRETIRQIEQGVERGDPITSEFSEVLDKPEIRHFSFARPGLPALRARLDRIQRSREAVEREHA